LNVDVGEGLGVWTVGNDLPFLAIATSVNIACGFHAGDPQIMDKTVAAAMDAGVAIGAHPGFRDLHGFGRREMTTDPAEVEAEVLYQVGALAAFARAHGSRLTHVKPHGALYNQAARDPVLARALASAVRRAGEELVLVGLASSLAMRRAAEAEGLRFAAEAFADRAYEADGSLRSRRSPGAVLSDPETAARQAVRLARDGRVASWEGSEISLSADTLCVHGDNPDGLAIARAVRLALEAEGITVSAFSR